MATSPTPSLDSIRGINSIESYGEHNGYLSDSPLTLSGSSPPVSDSAICDEFNTTNINSNNQHHPISASVSSSSSSSSSGLSGCGSTSSADSNASSSTGVIGSNLNNITGSVGGGVGGKASPCNDLLLNNSNSIISLTGTNGTTSTSSIRCTACKSKQSDAVAKCFECISFLCANCVTAHEFMHCFHGHNVSLIKPFNDTHSNSNNNNNGSNSPASSIIVASNNPASTDFNYSSSLTMMLQQQQQQHKQQNQSSLTQLSKIVLNSHAAATAAAAAAANDDVFSGVLPPLSLRPQQQQPQQQQQQQLFCHRHKHELLKFSCRTCCTLVCKDCVISEHSIGLHEIEHVQEHALPSIAATNTTTTTSGNVSQSASEAVVQSLLSELRARIGEMVSMVNNSDNSVGKIKVQYQKAHNEVNETYQFFCSMLDERKQEMLKELESIYNAKITSNNAWLHRSKELIEKTVQTSDAIERAPKAHSVTDVLMLRKTLELQLQAALQDMHLPFELEFMSNYQSIQAGVRNTFGYIRSTTANTADLVGGGAIISAGNNNQKQPPIARPTQSSSNSSSSSVSSASHLTGGLGFATSLLDNSYVNSVSINGTVTGAGGSSFLSGRGGINHHHHHYGSNSNQSSGGGTFEDIIPRRFQSGGGSSVANAVAVSPFVGVSGVNPYEKWSNGGSDNIFSAADTFSSAQLLNSLTNSTTSITSTSMGSSTLSSLNLNATNSSTDSLMDLTSKLLSSSYPPKSQIKRQKMIYHCKFGEFGVLEGQFTEPSGVAVNAQNDIIVADTNNHRIQIFDKEGRFKFHFGECGKRDSQLLYPNRVAVVRTSGDIIVTERSPTHQIQIYNQYGQFVRKFGANILQHPRGVTVDNKGRIIVVECKVMRVIIFDQNGEVLHKFGCSKHLEFPNGVVVNDKQEIFISDNRAHCVKVFNYEGQYLRQIGGEGVTNYPIGVGINSNGEILIADNHNNFNLTIFTQDGQLVSALESKVKHAQCFDVALMDDGSVVLASKDYRLYIYRYVQVPPTVI